MGLNNQFSSVTINNLTMNAMESLELMALCRFFHAISREIIYPNYDVKQWMVKMVCDGLSYPDRLQGQAKPCFDILRRSNPK